MINRLGIIVTWVCIAATGFADDPLRVHIGPEPQSLDWHTAIDGISAIVSMNIMEGLVGYDLTSDEIKIIPKLAERFQANGTYDKWTFWLKPGLKWSDGVPLTPQHFVDAWKRLLAPASGSPNANRFFLIKGAQEFNRGEIDFAKVGIKVTPENAIEISLKSSAMFFPQLLTTFYSFPIRMDLVEKYGGQWSKPQNLVCLGPYCLQKKQSPQEMQLQANENYHGSKPEFAKMSFVWLDNKKTAMRLFKQGKLDVVRAPEWNQVEALSLNDSYQSVPSLGIFYLVFNFQEPPGNQLAFRRAVKEAIATIDLKKMSGKDADVMTEFFPAEVLSRTASSFTPASDSRGEVWQKDKYKIRLGTNSSPLNKKAMEVIAFHLQKKMGTPVDVRLADSISYFTQLQHKPELDLMRLSFTPGVLDPHGYANLFTSTSTTNFGRYSSKEMDALVMRAAGETNPQKRVDLYLQIEDRLLNRDIVLIPLFKQRQSLLVQNARVQLAPHSTERLELSYAKKPKK